MEFLKNNKTGKLLYVKEYISGKIWNVKKYDKINNNIDKLKDWKGFMEEYKENGDLIFEGEYLNGERNGKGKEYKHNEIIFEGEYLNGKRNWKRKEYDELGILIYEGKFLNGKRNGKGKEYYYDNKLKFEGEYSYDERINGKKYNDKGNLE